MFFLVTQGLNAKSKPTPLNDRLIAFKRAKSLDNGISVTWLEQTWNKEVLSQQPLKKADFELLKQLGFKSLRLPVAFSYFADNQISDEKVFAHIDDVLKQCKLYGIKLVLDYHYGKINDNNYLTETTAIIAQWLKLTKRYKNASADELFFELYNEPPHMDPKVWHDAAYNIITAIRKVDKHRTLIVGASNFNSIYELSRTERFADDNIIYTFHFYEPFMFTHQGATWVGDQVATTGIPFPYNAQAMPQLADKAKGTWGETNFYQYKTDGNARALKDKLTIVKKWADKYYVPIICGEYGAYNQYADAASRCAYIKAMRATLKELKIPGMLWDYNGNFSIFDGPPSMGTLPDCMKQAIDYSAAKQY